MDVAVAALTFVPGLVLGSFLNVVAARVPDRRSLVRPRSSCAHCEAPIAWHDNVPLVSYVALRGRCRRCRAMIGARYPLVELATAALVACCFLRFGVSARAFVAALFVAALVALSAIDLERRILPDAIVLPTTALVVAAQIVLFPERALEWTIAALGASLFLFLALVAYPAGMGMGDVKLALLLGAALGWHVSVALAVGMLAALAPALVLLARHGTRARKMAIPLGPFLALGSVVALFFGETIVDWYLGAF